MALKVSLHRVLLTVATPAVRRSKQVVSRKLVVSHRCSRVPMTEATSAVTPEAVPAMHRSRPVVNHPTMEATSVVLLYRQAVSQIVAVSHL